MFLIDEAGRRGTRLTHVFLKRIKTPFACLNDPCWENTLREIRENLELSQDSWEVQLCQVIVSGVTSDARTESTFTLHPEANSCSLLALPESQAGLTYFYF